jgi:hypothetical protein
MALEAVEGLEAGAAAVLALAGGGAEAADFLDIR